MRAREFIVETVDESQVLNYVATKVTDNIIEILNEKPNFVERMLRFLFNPLARASTRQAELSLFTMAITDLGAPQTTVPSVDRVLSRLRVRADLVNGPTKDEKGMYNSTMGGYSRNANAIILYVPSLLIKGFQDDKPVYRSKEEFRSEMIATLVHELQHALDDWHSYGKALKSANPEQDNNAYLRSPDEINARFQEALLELSTMINDMKGTDYELEMKNLPNVINSAFAKSNIDKLMFKKPQQYNRLINRAYKFFEMELQKPIKEQPMKTMKRAWNWILGRPTTHLYR